MSSEHAARLKLARELKGLTQGKLAKAVGLSQGTIGNIEAGTRGFGASVVRLASVLDCDPQWLATGEGESPSTVPRTKSVRYLTQDPTPAPSKSDKLLFAGMVSPSKIKVAGMAKLAVDGFFEELFSDSPAALGSVSALSDDPAAYAMRIIGDAGFPAIRDGEYIVIEPSLTPGPTDRVVIALRDGRMLLQELIVERADAITVVCLNGANRRTIQREDIRDEFGIQVITHIVSPRKWTKDGPPS